MGGPTTRRLIAISQLLWAWACCALSATMLTPVTLAAVFSAAVAAPVPPIRPTLVWPSGATNKTTSNLFPEPVPNLPRSYSSIVRIFLTVPGRGNVTMEGAAAADGVIGYARTSVFERVTPVDRPESTFPETQITNENRGTISYLRKPTNPPSDDVSCSVRQIPPPPPPTPGIQWAFLGYGFLNYHVAAVFQLNEGAEVTQGLYQDAFTQEPLAIVNIQDIPGSDAVMENIAVFERDFVPLAPAGENFIVPEGIECTPAASGEEHEIANAIAALPWTKGTK